MHLVVQEFLGSFPISTDWAVKFATNFQNKLPNCDRLGNEVFQVIWKASKTDLRNSYEIAVK